MTTLGWVGIIAGVLVLAIILWYISTANTLIRKKNNIEEAFSTMDVQMKERYDLVPNLVETVKGYMKHEKDTLTGVIDCRNKALSATTMEEKAKAEGELSSIVSRLLALTENYPDLKANTNFLDLQNQLTNIEAKIANSRKYYNACVKDFNNLVMLFPSSIVARRKGYKKEVFFEISEAERKNVKVQF
ncbi:MAG: LemA family protein [Clostridiales bacterium]|nr:LemA family protein [Clostridiales bacterium]